MEQGRVFPAGTGGAGSLNRHFVLARFRDRPPPGVRRGDHDLNPDMLPDKPLTKAAVLVPLVERRDRLTVMLTRRTDHLQDHAGQVSFPGGRLEADDADAAAAALREAEEEVGLPRHHVSVIGRLDTYVTRTGFEVAPVVALVDPPGAFTPDPFEVAEVFEMPLDVVIDPANYRRQSRVYGGRERFFWVLPWQNYSIWGATAGMLVNLADVLRREP
ncbi:MAG: CoA pyrophosphatase [Dongiaceae bacterium]